LVNQIIDTHAGIEIAATKSFIAQLMAFYFLALIGLSSASPIPNSIREIITGLRQMPAQIETILVKSAIS